MPRLYMIDDIRYNYTDDFPPWITYEQRERVREWFNSKKCYFK
ncbi:hypothetical protein [ANMV-1 virus]|nr:hypothetical protein [ANMV-1 virus]